MISPLHAGLDWTATPSLNEPFAYGPGMVAVEEVEKFEAALEKIRARFGFRGEIKGHNSSGEVLEAVLMALWECEARVGVWLLDKTELAKCPSRLPAPAILRHQMACALVAKFLEIGPLVRLVCDEEIRGKSEWSAFRSEILRLNREIQPNFKLKVASYPSHQSALVQASDCLAYVFSREVGGRALESGVRRKLRELRQRDANLFVVSRAWPD